MLRRTGTVLAWAKTGGHVTENVARDLTESLRGLNGRKAEPRKALPYQTLPAFYRSLRAFGTDGAGGALALVLVSGLRSKEGRLARWEEMDLDGRVWTVPPGRMKGQPGVPCPPVRCGRGRPRRRRPAPERPRPSPPGAAVRSATRPFERCCPTSPPDATVHGFRSSFRDFCGERGVAREVAEGCLAHKVGSSVEQAYARSDLLERRREVMQAYGAFCAGGGAG